MLSWVCVHHVCAVANGDLKRALDPLELEFQKVVNYPVIGTRPGFSARTYIPLNPEQSL